MNGADWRQHTKISVAAVLAQLKMPTGTLAALGACDALEINSATAAPTVSFKIGGMTVARGRLSLRDGRVIATIFWTGCEAADGQFDRWRVRKRGEATFSPE